MPESTTIQDAGGDTTRKLMKCPKCGFSQANHLPTCKSCGLAFDTWVDSPAPLDTGAEPVSRNELIAIVAASIFLVSVLGTGLGGRRSSHLHNATDPVSPVEDDTEHGEALDRVASPIEPICAASVRAVGGSEEQVRVKCSTAKVKTHGSP
jgi:hypothetical protein